MSDRPGPGACRQTTRTHTTAAAEEEGQGGRQQQGHKPPLGRDSRTWGPHTDAALNFLIFPIQVQSSTDDPRTPIEENDEGKKVLDFSNVSRHEHPEDRHRRGCLKGDEMSQPSRGTSGT